MQEQLFTTLEAHLGRKWKWIALRGAAALIFGILAIFQPWAAIWSLALLWGAFAMADGVFALMGGWRMHKQGLRWWPYLVFGIIGVVAGFITLIWPAITAITFIYILGFWALFGGISEIVAAVRLRKEIQDEWLLALAGGISVIFGLLILLRPLPEGVVAIAWLIGFFAIITGILQLMLAFKVRGKG